MSQLSRTLAVPAAALVLLTAAARVDGDLRGYTAESSRIEREWEGKFRAIPEPARMREAMRRLTLRPHHVGSPYDKDNAEWLRDQFKLYGWDASIEEFQVLFPVPTERVLEMVSPTKFTAPVGGAALTGGDEDMGIHQRLDHGLVRVAGLAELRAKGSHQRLFDLLVQ